MQLRLQYPHTDNSSLFRENNRNKRKFQLKLTTVFALLLSISPSYLDLLQMQHDALTTSKEISNRLADLLARH